MNSARLRLAFKHAKQQRTGTEQGKRESSGDGTSLVDIPEAVVQSLRYMHVHWSAMAQLDPGGSRVHVRQQDARLHQVQADRLSSLRRLIPKTDDR